MDGTDINSKEKRAIRYLAALDSSLIIFEKDLEPRLKTLPDAWRRYRVAKAMLGKVISELYASLPIDSRIYLRTAQRNEEILIRPKAPVDPGLKIVSDRFLNVVVSIAMDSECRMCIKTPAEVRGCKLRKELIIVLPPEGTTSSGRCPYLDTVIAPG